MVADKMDIDDGVSTGKYTAGFGPFETDPDVETKIAEAVSLGESAGVQAAIDKLLSLERINRNAGAAPETAAICVNLIRLLHKKKDWKAIGEYAILISKRRAQLKAAVQKTVQEIMSYLDETPDEKTKLSMLETLRDVTAGKIFVELERARLTRTLAKIKEEKGDIDTAATIMQEMQVETFGGMERLVIWYIGKRWFTTSRREGLAVINPKVSSLTYGLETRFIRNVLMEESSAFRTSLPDTNSNRDARRERRQGYWNRIFKIAKKDKGSIGLEPNEEASSQPIAHDVSHKDHMNGKRRARSFHKPRSRMKGNYAPRSAKFFALTGLAPRTRFLGKQNVTAIESKLVGCVENQDAKVQPIDTPSPSSIVLRDGEADTLPIARRKISFRAIRHTEGNSTMLFGKENTSSPKSFSTPKNSKSETRDDFWLESLASEEKQHARGLRTRSLLDISELPSMKAHRRSSVVPFVSNNSIVNAKSYSNRKNEDEGVSTHSDDTSSDPFENTASGGSRMFSFRSLFREPLAQDQRANSRHFSFGSNGQRLRQNTNNDGSNRLLARRSSSLPQITQSNVRAIHQLASSDDGLQCPWGVKANKKRDALSGRQYVHLTTRIADLSSALNGKRGHCLSSTSINLSDGDYERGEFRVSEKSNEVEMQQDDFIEYTVKIARKQRK
ncbi:unnamed protein product [Agarophyton chilense]